MTLLAGWAAVLGGCWAAGCGDWNSGGEFRGRVEIENLIGFFRQHVSSAGESIGSPGVSELVGRVKEQALKAHSIRTFI